MGVPFPFMGTPIPQMREYACDICGDTCSDEIVPECKRCGVWMEPVEDQR